MNYDLNRRLAPHLIRRASDVPAGAHWAIVAYGSRSGYHEGDERSRTNPGHGYPAYTEEVDLTSHYVFRDESSWRAALADLHQDVPGTFVAFGVLGIARVRMTVRVDVTAHEGEP